MPERVRPATGTYLGIDYGRKGIGVAVGQALTRSARPIETLKTTAETHLWQSLRRLVRDFDPDGFVVGVPLPMEDTPKDNPLIDEIAGFNQRLSSEFGLPVHVMDETLSTRASQSHFHELRPRRSISFRAVKDQMAAALILESWLLQTNPQDLDA